MEIAKKKKARRIIKPQPKYMTLETDATNNYGDEDFGNRLNIVKSKPGLLLKKVFTGATLPKINGEFSKKMIDDVSS